MLTDMFEVERVTMPAEMVDADAKRENALPATPVADGGNEANTGS